MFKTRSDRVLIEELQFPYQNNLIWLHGLRTPSALTSVELKQVSNFMYDEEFVTVTLHSKYIYKKYKQQILGAML